MARRTVNENRVPFEPAIRMNTRRSIKELLGRDTYVTFSHRTDRAIERVMLSVAVILITVSVIVQIGRGRLW